MMGGDGGRWRCSGTFHNVSTIAAFISHARAEAHVTGERTVPVA